jgi:hypothetical protein
MIISLFMDETPVVCGSGHNLGARGGIRRPGQKRRHSHAQREHDANAEEFHM